jgi:hypothetical protein
MDERIEPIGEDRSDARYHKEEKFPEGEER